MRSKIQIGLVLSCSIAVIWLLGQLYHQLLGLYEHNGILAQSEYSWVFRLLLNCVGYSTVLLPAFLLYKYLQKINYFEKISNSTWVSRALHTLYAEQNERIPDTIKPKEDEKREVLEMIICFSGLMGSYLIWGLLQEKIMTQEYVWKDGSVSRFNDSQFLVLINRVSAFALAFGRLRWTGEPVFAAPLYKFSYCSLTNIVSAWCQYEALKYVSFPTQVLSKSCKVIPVMVMGKIVSRAHYQTYEYLTALLISAGMALFLFSTHENTHASAAMGVSGVCLLALYMACDSFTSSWQAALFQRYTLKPLQMMCAVTLCSCALAAASAPLRPATLTLLRHPMFVVDCLLLSASSALGQVLIYRTIARFGAVVFTIVMTLRQAVSILISCAVYGHPVSLAGAGGVLVVFVAVFIRIHCRRRARKHTHKPV
ncbi:adenosine 3'-phospho 5'-phosphosulfate transporter 1 [Pieris napi]|uniref:adenosine 3'-phospho 5'-phosphosulfate transporter 1 n=1 Tax=Pieris napi TaxID=78633 RepID=UPI001FB9DD54|nr:adenosine 3'-phospho 5'-phosphosulfate transporter 1 [Pieris napi]